MSNGKKSLLSTILITCFLFPIGVFASGGDVIGEYKYGKHKRVVLSIPKWQNDILDELGVPFQTKLYLKTINTLECGHQDGFCDNGYDVGPFQINIIHGTFHKWGKNMVKKGKEEIAKAKETGDWSEVMRIRDELYKAQSQWTWDRMKSQVQRFKLPEDRELRMYKLAVLHNGSDYRYDYANKAVIAYKILKSHYDKNYAAKKKGGGI